MTERAAKPTWVEVHTIVLAPGKCAPRVPGDTQQLPLLAAGKMPRRMNHVRIGEGILLGCETLHRTAWSEASQDAFLLHAAVIELKEQRSVPIGATSEDVTKRPLPGGC